MEFKDYYKVMGLERSATPDEIKQAHRRLARKLHPDVSKEPHAEARFKELAEAYDVLKDAEKRASYDQLGSNWNAGQDFRPPPDWQSRQRPAGGNAGPFSAGQSGSKADQSEFFDSLFRNMGGASRSPPGQSRRETFDMQGQDQHAKIQINIEDSYLGATRTIELRTPVETADGHVQMQNRSIEFVIPKGIRAGQHIRLAAQGSPGMGSGGAGDLYLDVEFLPHPRYRADKHDVYMDLPLTPWEAALGAEVEAPTPTGQLEVKVPAGSANGRKLRLKGRGLPGKTPGDFYFVLQVALPAADTAAAKQAYTDLAAAFAGFDPRAALKQAGQEPGARP